MNTAKNLAKRLRGRTVAAKRAERADELRRATEEHQRNLREAEAVLPRMTEALRDAARGAADMGHRSTYVSIGDLANTPELIALLTQWAKRHEFRGRCRYVAGGRDLSGDREGGFYGFEIKW